MKRCFSLATAVFLLVASHAHGQLSFNFNEFFKQRKTELKYLGQQIVELQVYLQYVKQGYKIVDQGNKLIQQAKNGELTIHDIFYLSLKLVNQQIKNYPAVRKTIDHHQYVASTSTALLRKADASPYLSGQEKEYAQQTIARLRDDMSASLDELMEVLSDHKLEMSDSERIRKIESLEAYARQRVLFIKSYYTHLMGAVVDRTRETAGNAVIRSLHGIE